MALFSDITFQSMEEDDPIPGSDDSDDDFHVANWTEAHVRFVKKNGEATLVNMLNGEQIRIAAGGPDRYDCIRCPNLQIHSTSCDKYGDVVDLFQSSIVFDSVAREVSTVHDGNAETISLQTFGVSPQYIGLEIDHVKSRLKFYSCKWRCPSIWWEVRVLGSPMGAKIHQWFKSLRGHVTNWKPNFDQYMQLYRGIGESSDVRRKSSSYLACFPETSVSTGALLIIALHRIVSGRPCSERPATLQFVRCFMDKFFVQEFVDVKIIFAEDKHILFGTSPALPDLCIPIEGGLVAVDVCSIFR